MQNRRPFRVLGRVIFKLLPEFRVLEARREAIHKTPSPRRWHCQARLNFGVRDLMLCFWFDGLTGKMSEARRESISERTRHRLDEGAAGTGRVDYTFAFAAREKLAAFPSRRLAHGSVWAHLADCGRA